MSNADTDPDAKMPLEPVSELDEDRTVIDEKTRAESNELMAKFMRAHQRPPAPTPDHLPFSDGRPFVAYQAVHSPAAAGPSHISEPGVRIDPVLLERDAGQDELSLRVSITHVIPRVQIRRYLVRIAVVMFALLVVVLVMTRLFHWSAPPALATAPSEPPTDTAPTAARTTTTPSVPMPTETAAPSVVVAPSPAPLTVSTAAARKPRPVSPQTSPSATPPVDPLKRSASTIPEDPL